MATAVSITGGDTARYSVGFSSVPKRDLVAALGVPFYAGELKTAESPELWPTLKE